MRLRMLDRFGRMALPALLVAAILVAAGPASAQRDGASGPSDYQERPARFAVSTDVVMADLPPFTATIGAFGNALIKDGGGFEPVIWRDKFNALQNSPDRVVIGPSIVRWDTLREGFLDGAEVRVYRIVNGEFRLVREDTVPEGGAAMSGWLNVTSDEQVIPADTHKHVWQWAGYNRPEVPYYFTVKAVDKAGNESAPAEAVSVIRPDEVGTYEGKNPTERFRKPRNSDDAAAPPTPRNLQAKLLDNGTLELTWDAVEADDLAGYRVYRSDYAPEEHRGYHLKLANKPSDPEQFIREGDLIIVSKPFYTFSRAEFHSNRVWDAGRANKAGMPGLISFYPDEAPDKSWRLARHVEDTPVEGAGETYLELKLGGEDREALATYNHSGTAQGWYEVLKTQPYKVEVWLRADGENPRPVTFRLNGYYDGKIEPITFQPTNEWQKFEATFTPPEVQPSSRPNQMRLEFEGPATYHVDNYAVYRADTAPYDYYPEQYEQLAEARMMSLRTHGPIKTGTDTYDMAQFTNAAPAISGVRKSNTLPQALKMMRKAGVHPWLQIEMHMSPAEWQGFVEYMAAPYDPATDSPQSKPWAYKRHRQGQTRPWVDEFDRIYFEISNETWNWLFRPWIFESMNDAATGGRYGRGEVYGMFQEHIRDVMRDSPYWSAQDLDEKFVFVLGGWSGQRYGREAAAYSPNSDYMTIAAYNGGWDEGEGPAAVNDPSFFNVLAQVNQTAIPRAERHLAEIQQINADRDEPIKLGTYEAGPGYALNGLNGARVTKEQAWEQEQVMKSMAAGTATLDSFLARAYRQFEIQNFFTYSEGRTWSSHAEWYHGGQGYPSWKLLALFNREALGDMLATETIEAPTVDLPRHRRRQEVDNAPLAAVYATREGDRVSVFVISRKIAGYPQPDSDGYTPVTVELPFSEAESVELYKMAGDPRAHNVRSDEVKIEHVKLPADVVDARFAVNAATGADERGLPPAATLLYVFEGTNID